MHRSRINGILIDCDVDDIVSPRAFGPRRSAVRSIRTIRARAAIT
jgi:hypothetical protein